ncbi:MAG: hypothetical protein K8R23_15930 [Chthoniobacter sp.]|nr:hypothetical protein [Chthoniobacter sp.]
MRAVSIALILLVALWRTSAAHADAPATEFFAIETAKLAKLAPTDAELDALSRTQLAEISLANGWYADGLSWRSLTTTLRIDARFSGRMDYRGEAPAPITYQIYASHDQTSWSLLAERGTATKQGKQFVTENWRKQKITVILRYLNLKH